MRFEIEQRFSAPAPQVAHAYTDPDLYDALQGLPKLSRPEVLERRADGDIVRLQIRYRFGGELSSAARAVLDPQRLTWVEHSVHDLAALHTSFTMVPDHYGDRFRCEGSYDFEPTDAGSRRVGRGDLRVRAPLVAVAVERAIVSGLREHLADEVEIVEAFISH